MPPVLANEPIWQAGMSRVDVTPKEPVRLAGYGNRALPSAGVDTPLYVRALALKHADAPPHVLVAVETIGLPGATVQAIAQQIEQQHHLPRQCVVITSTHTHCAPDLASDLSNIFSSDLTEPERSAAVRYRRRLESAIVAAVDRALGSLAPARLDYGVGEADFAANRRVILNGRWTAFGVDHDGPVDHSVPVLRIRGVDGEVRGVLFSYACHCTTLGGDHNRVNAEWAGYAAVHLESHYANSVAICTIGCGADANPFPLGSRILAQRHGLALAREVQRIADGEMMSVEAPISAAFDYAGLSFDLPTIEQLNVRCNDSSPQIRRHAEHFREVYLREGRLPATYPLPIQVWRFGNQLTMIFLGGEVVADYAIRLNRELAPQRVWVTAYANDVPGYIASERMRTEGGYEVDQSAVYYNLPGPWAAGTEDQLVHRVHDLLGRKGPQSPLEPAQALNTISVPSGFTAQLVATEPLIASPINLAFGHDGSLWVVEMGDYPSGGDGGSPGGRVKRLTDSDGDGKFDRADVFLAGISFPTAVYPWRDGAIVCSAPEIFFARDTNGDGRADERESMVRGFPLANPQHRVNGFEYGLDHSLHCAAGDNLGDLTAMRTGERANASGHDVQLWPDSGRLAVTSGRSQFIRSRNDWGDWFGSENSRPMFHFPIDDRYFRRNAAVRFSDNKQQLFDPPVAPSVYPLSITVDRFNDLFASNRFTSACSAIIVRSKSAGEGLAGAALICEPVHNLVHRALLQNDGTTYRAVRAPTEEQSEFLRSTDPWFRPVRVTVGPDGMIWVVDMYRAVIEHPEWIPQAWQQQLDLRAGSDRGRIYRIVPTAATGPVRLPVFGGENGVTLAAKLSSDCGPLRDMAQQELLWRGDKSAAPTLRRLAASSPQAETRVQALWVLAGLHELRDDELLVALNDKHSGVVRNAILLAEPRIGTIAILQSLTALVDHPDPRVRLQLALTLGESPAPAAGAALAQLARAAPGDRWLSRAVVSSSTRHSLPVLESLLSLLTDEKGESLDMEGLRSTISDLIATSKSAGTSSAHLVARTISRAAPSAPWVFPLAAAYVESSPEAATADAADRAVIDQVYQRARNLALDTNATVSLRCQALRLFGHSLGRANEEQSTLAEIITPTSPLELQFAAIDRLATFRDRDSATWLLSQWPAMSGSVRDAAGLQLSSNITWIEVLVAALESGTVSPGDLSLAVKQSLRDCRSESLHPRIEQVLGKSAVPNQELIQQYLRIQQQHAHPTDLTRGRELFRKHCSACHVADASGRATGPDLANLSDRSATTLIESILDPNRSAEPKYQGCVIILSDGRVLTGTIAEETGDSMTLALANGARVTIPRTDIEEMNNTGKSLMPEGFQHELDPNMMRDLVGFLQSELVSDVSHRP